MDPDKLKENMIAWRHHLHENPELARQESKTAEFVAARLAEMPNLEVAAGVGGHGIVATLKGCGDGPTIGLRADMDCIAERLGVPREDVSELLWTCTGERFLTIRKRLRIGDAKELLLSRPDMTMSQVARTVGFQDKSDFRRAFREETGCLPRIWRESRGKWLKCRIRAVREAGRNRCHELHKSA